MKRPTTVFSRLSMKVKQIVSPEARSPPYRFPVQVGDPILRMKSEEVKPEEIKSEKIKKLLKTMHYVFVQSKSVGISAPQVGVPLRVFMTELTEKECGRFPAEKRQRENIRPWPLKVFINPKLEVCDNSTSSATEACISFLGYAASVQRYAEVTVKGLNEEGQPISWQVSDFAARVVQHEMDHLDGTLYVDRMNSRTLESCNWKAAREQKELKIS